MSPALAVVAHFHSPGGHPPELLCPVLSTAVRSPKTRNLIRTPGTIIHELSTLHYCIYCIMAVTIFNKFIYSCMTTEHINFMNSFHHMYWNRTHHVSGTSSVPVLRPAPSKTECSDHQHHLRTVSIASVCERQYLQWPEMYFVYQSSERFAQPKFRNCHGNMSYWLSILQSVFIENVNEYRVVIFCSGRSKSEDGNRSYRRNAVCSINFNIYAGKRPYS